MRRPSLPHVYNARSSRTERTFEESFRARPVCRTFRGSSCSRVSPCSIASAPRSLDSPRSWITRNDQWNAKARGHRKERCCEGVRRVHATGYRRLLVILFVFPLWLDDKGINHSDLCDDWEPPSRRGTNISRLLLGEWIHVLYRYHWTCFGGCVQLTNVELKVNRDSMGIAANSRTVGRWIIAMWGG